MSPILNNIPFPGPGETSAHDLADQINDLYKAGHPIEIDGHTVDAYPGTRPASVYRNGTLTVGVTARNGRVRFLFFKLGTPAPKLRWTETSPNGVDHLVFSGSGCVTCGKVRHDWAGDSR